MRDPIKIIAIAIATFLVLLYSTNTGDGITWDCTWQCMNWFDKTLMVLFCACLAWLFYVGLTRGKK